MNIEIIDYCFYTMTINYSIDGLEQDQLKIDREKLHDMAEADGYLEEDEVHVWKGGEYDTTEVGEISFDYWLEELAEEKHCVEYLHWIEIFSPVAVEDFERAAA